MVSELAAMMSPRRLAGTPGEPDSQHPAMPLRRWPWGLAAVVLVIVVVVGAVLIGRTAGPASTQREHLAPALVLPNLRPGRPPVDLASLRGRPVVVNFWASWCVPCQEEMPALERVFRQVGNRIDFLGVDHQDGSALAIPFLDKTGVSYPSGYDPQGKIAPTFDVQGLPTTVFISRTGIIVGRHLGPYTARQLRADLDRLFPA